MSELYDHLKRLQGKHQRVLDEGVPFPASQGRREEPSGAGRSKRLLLAVPLACVVLGLLTVAAVVAVRKFSEDGPGAKSQKIARVPNAAPESPLQALEMPQKNPAEPYAGAPLRAPEGVDAVGKGAAASEGVPGEPDSPNKEAVPKMGTGDSSGGPGSRPIPPGEKAAEPSVKASGMATPTSGSSTVMPPVDSPPSGLTEVARPDQGHGKGAKVAASASAGSLNGEIPALGLEKEAISQSPSSAESGSGVPVSAATPGDALRAERKSPLRSKEGAVAKSPKKEIAPLDGVGDGSRHVLVMAEEARRMGDWEEAARGYREYLARKSDPSVMNNLGAVLLAQGRFTEAEQVLAQAFNRSADPDIGANLAVAYWFQGKKDAACLLVFSLQENSSAAGALESLGPMRYQCRRDR
uniref:Tetratricopeptide repeat protein n=1 Tax=Desulfacinum infernum TaxID=35837 RepID=A0A832A3H2_9BACT